MFFNYSDLPNDGCCDDGEYREPQIPHVRLHLVHKGEPETWVPSTDEILGGVDYGRLYGALKKFRKLSDDEGTARCPFHDDRGTSLRLFLNTGRFWCPECGQTGSPLKLLANARKKRPCFYCNPIEWLLEYHWWLLPQETVSVNLETSGDDPNFMFVHINYQYINKHTKELEPLHTLGFIRFGCELFLEMLQEDTDLLLGDAALLCCRFPRVAKKIASLPWNQPAGTRKNSIAVRVLPTPGTKWGAQKRVHPAARECTTYVTVRVPGLYQSALRAMGGLLCEVFRELPEHLQLARLVPEAEILTMSEKLLSISRGDTRRILKSGDGSMWRRLEGYMYELLFDPYAEDYSARYIGRSDSEGDTAKEHTDEEVNLHRKAPSGRE